MAEPTYFEVLTAAIDDMAEHGYDSVERVAMWQARLKEAAQRSFRSVAQMDADLRRVLQASYARLVDRNGALKLHPGVGRYTYEMIKPRLRAELDRRIASSLDLIKLHREESMATQARRFAGWATSIPSGGATSDVDRRALKAEIRKPLARLPFEDRRVMIDQSAKLVSSIHATIAEDGGAIAAKWRHVHQAGYDGRPEHIARDGKMFLIRGSWADKQGLVKPAQDPGYTDEIEQPAEFVYCRCAYVYVYSPQRLPADMLTEKGRAALAAAKLAA